MTLEYFIVHYGYWAILVGTFFEGETILLLGGFVAHRGYLSFPGVILAAFIGTLAGDQLFFFLGRKFSHKILAWRPSWQTRADKVNRLLEKYRTGLILMFRFMYGLRAVTPFVIGTSSVSAIKFVLLNVVGALVWTTVVGTGGYLFGNFLEILIGRIKHYEIEIMGGIALAGALAWAFHFYRQKRKKDAGPSSLTKII